MWPGLMYARTLMVGCAAGEGHLDGEDEFAWRFNAQLLASAIVSEAKRQGAGIQARRGRPRELSPEDRLIR
jgi:hypothetical protein